MNSIDEATRALARLLRESPEYTEFSRASAAASSVASTKALLDSYRKLQVRIQAAELSGGADEGDLLNLQRLGELLQMDPVSADYIFAQYKLNALLGRVYKALADAVDADLSMID